MKETEVDAALPISQSHHPGIEIRLAYDPVEVFIISQSHHPGIEIRKNKKHRGLDLALNRTILELKLCEELGRYWELMLSIAPSWN